VMVVRVMYAGAKSGSFPGIFPVKFGRVVPNGSGVGFASFG
jgi:hypothetical protein